MTRTAEYETEGRVRHISEVIQEIRQHPERLQALENAFRRGYQHGVSNTLDSFMPTGAAGDEARRWERDVATWREGRSPDHSPPVPYRPLPGDDDEVRG